MSTLRKRDVAQLVFTAITYREEDPLYRRHSAVGVGIFFISDVRKQVYNANTAVEIKTSLRLMQSL